MGITVSKTILGLPSSRRHRTIKWKPGHFTISRTRKRSGSRSSRSSRYYKHANMPEGTWTKTAKDYYVKHGILYAKLQNNEGEYIRTSIKYDKDDILENQNGKFVKTGIKDNYTKDTFNVYYNLRKVDDLSPHGFKSLGNGYARDSFNVVYNGKLVPDVMASNFKSLGDGYAKDSFAVFYKGRKLDVLNVSGFQVVGNGKAKDGMGYFINGRRV